MDYEDGFYRLLSENETLKSELESFRAESGAYELLFKECGALKATITRLEAEKAELIREVLAREATAYDKGLEDVLKGLHSEDDSTQLRAIINSVEGLKKGKQT